MNYLHLATEIVSGLYIIFSAIGLAFPTTKVGAFCAKYGATLRKLEELGK